MHINAVVHTHIYVIIYVYIYIKVVYIYLFIYRYIYIHINVCLCSLVGCQVFVGLPLLSLALCLWFPPIACSYSNTPATRRPPWWLHPPVTHCGTIPGMCLSRGTPFPSLWTLPGISPLCFRLARPWTPMALFAPPRTTGNLSPANSSLFSARSTRVIGHEVAMLTSLPIAL